MACLSILQDEQGWVSADAEAAVADYLGIAKMAVHEVTTFYNMYNQRTRWRVQVERVYQLALPAAQWSKRVALPRN